MENVIERYLKWKGIENFIHFLRNRQIGFASK